MKSDMKLPLIIILATFVTGCYTSRHSSVESYDDYNDQTDYYVAKNEVDRLDNGWSGSTDTNVDGIISNQSLTKLEAKVELSTKQDGMLQDAKIIYSANLRLTVKSVDNTVDSIKAIAKQYKGYVSEAGSYKSVIRVESQYLHDAVKALSELGKIDHKQIQGKDITDQYRDYKIRLDNAEKARLRYLELLEKAENVEAALKVEKELERLNGTIDLLKGKMNRLNHLTQYSTITIRLNEQVKPGILGYIGIGVYRSVKWLFVRN